MYELQSSREFSPLDEMLPPFYFAYLLAFSMPHDLNQETIKSLLQSSMSALVAEYPYLTGNIRRDNSGKVFRLGHLALDVPEPLEDTKISFEDLVRIGSEFKWTYSELKASGMPLQNLDARVLAPLTAGIGQTRKVLSVQANFIHGGLLLAFCFHHSFVTLTVPAE